MYMYNEPYSIRDIKTNSALVGTANNEAISDRKFMIANTGAQPMYFKEKSIDGVDCTASNGMLISANSVFPTILTAKTLSLISNSTGTSYAIMFLDI